MLQVKDLFVSYGQAKALQGVNLHVKPGEVVALIGRNGAGKTSLLRAISGLAKIGSGQVIFQGKDIAGKDPDFIRRLGLVHVPQGRLIFADQTVEDNLLLGGYTIYGKQKQKIRESIEREYRRFPRLAERRKQMAGTLSGGEQQMLAISRALITDPPFVALDEPSMGLAPVIVDQIMDNIAELRSQGVTVLLVEQMAAAALAVADRAYLLHTGQVRIEGTGQELGDHPEVIRQYLGAAV